MSPRRFAAQGLVIWCAVSNVGGGGISPFPLSPFSLLLSPFSVLLAFDARRWQISASPSTGIRLTIPAPLADALRDRYVLDRELGRGGMATVYLAHDQRHDRPVALKVLHPELAQTLGPERFQREIHTAARLQHPHILTVHDSGEAAGQLWFTMPFVEGESLRDRLRRERQLSVDDALRIATEAARALEYAHHHGIVHRDIKPENIMLTSDGSTLVADFGIARALGGDEGLTQTGFAVGTPAYMSPEQAAGDKTLDARTDVYSLASVLFEMLAGEPPFTGATAQAIVVKRLTEPAPSVRAVRPTTPLVVDEAIRKALAPVPADRFATMGQFAQALHLTASGGTTQPVTATVAAATAATAPVTSGAAPRARRRVPVAALTLGLGFLVGLGVLFAWRRGHPGADTVGGTRVVAVLPFENLGDSSDAYFADGVGDEVRSKLTSIGGLSVIARGSSNQYRHTTKSTAEIARELGADYLLTATVRWDKVAGSASRVRVSPELVDVGPGHAPRTRWSQPFDAALTDVFQVQGEIAAKVANALDIALADSAQRKLEAAPTANLAAYDAYLKGLANLGTDPATLRRAIAYYEQAVALDSTFVVAWYRLTRARSSLYFNGVPTPEVAAAAKYAAERTVALKPDGEEAALAQASYYGSVELENQKALAALEHGLAASTNKVELLARIAQFQQFLNRWDGTLEPLQRAAALDPRSSVAASRVAGTLLYLRRYAEAKPAADRALALAPADVSLAEQRVMVSLAEGDLPGARAVMAASGGQVDSDALLAYLAIYQDLYWVLDESQQQRVLGFPVAAFDGDAATRAIVRAQIFDLRGDQRQARINADSARIGLEEQLRAAPLDGQRRVFHGLALAFMGRKAEAIAEGRRGAELWPISRDANNGAYVQHQLARIYMIVGEPELAMDQLEPLLKMPYYLSPGWLRIDPTWARLKGNPRFKRLAAGG
jgi:eukaryotic-like serine/threonine-protein kinase